jgi:hypothetical protein
MGHLQFRQWIFLMFPGTTYHLPDFCKLKMSNGAFFYSRGIRRTYCGPEITFLTVAVTTSNGCVVGMPCSADCIHVCEGVLLPACTQSLDVWQVIKSVHFTASAHTRDPRD